MPSDMASEVEIQQKYYAESAHKYNEMHDGEEGEHYFALAMLVAMVNFLALNRFLTSARGRGAPSRT